MNMDMIKNVAKAMTTKESIKLMRDATATSVAGSIVGITVRNALYKRSKKKSGWYSRYIDNPCTQKWVKADNASVIVSAVIATALDTVLYLDRCGVIKLREENVEEKIKEYAANAYTMSDTNDSGITHEENNGVSYVKIKGVDPETIKK